MLSMSLWLSNAILGVWASHDSEQTTHLALHGRKLLAGVDCGDAFQPCCRVGQTCSRSNLVCVALASNTTMCEPCGGAFAQPCPLQQYCSSGELIPTRSAPRASGLSCIALCLQSHITHGSTDLTDSCARVSLPSCSPLRTTCTSFVSEFSGSSAGRADARVQCRPCGSEWQPCCPALGSLCHDSLSCYPEQDRCVAPEYIGTRENFTPVTSEFINTHVGVFCDCQCSICM